jgi:hypothetical protein
MVGWHGSRTEDTLLQLQLGPHIQLFQKLSSDPLPDETVFQIPFVDEEEAAQCQHQFNITAFLVKVQMYLMGFKEEGDDVIDWIVFAENPDGSFSAFIDDGEGNLAPFFGPFNLEMN